MPSTIFHLIGNPGVGKHTIGSELVVNAHPPYQLLVLDCAQRSLGASKTALLAAFRRSLLCCLAGQETLKKTMARA